MAIETITQRYNKRNHDWIMTHCFGCEEHLRFEGDPDDGIYLDEVGEFWNDDIENSVLMHPDCLPNGINAVFEGEDPDWKMA